MPCRNPCHANSFYASSRNPSTGIGIIRHLRCSPLAADQHHVHARTRSLRTYVLHSEPESFSNQHHYTLTISALKHWESLSLSDAPCGLTHFAEDLHRSRISIWYMLPRQRPPPTVGINAHITESSRGLPMSVFDSYLKGGEA